MQFIAIWIALSYFAGVVAKNKGRSFGGFFLLSLFFSPVIGFIAALIAGPNLANVEATKVNSGQEKKCPFCAELIKSEAVVCRFCGRDLPVESTSAEKPEITP